MKTSLAAVALVGLSVRVASAGGDEAATATAAETVFSKADELPLDADGFLATNWLLLSREGACETNAADRREWLEAAPWLHERSLGWAAGELAASVGLAGDNDDAEHAATFAALAADEKLPLDCLRAVCLQRGAPAWGAAHTAALWEPPSPASLDGGGDGAGAASELYAALSRWLITECQTVEMGAVSYHATPVRLTYERPSDSDDAVDGYLATELGVIEYSERHTKWRFSRLGDRWIARDAATGEVLRNETVRGDQFMVIGDPHWSKVGSEEALEIGKGKQDRIVQTRDLEARPPPPLPAAARASLLRPPPT